VNRSEGQWAQPELTFPVHRGLMNAPDKDRGLGMHWSADPSIARNMFATKSGHVIHADAPVSSVETNTKALDRWSVSSGLFPEEKEVPVKTGSTVKVTGITGPSGRTRTYNPPREMRA